MDDGPGVALDQGLRYFFTIDFRDGGACGGEHGGPLFGVVSVRGQDMDGVVF